MSRGSAGSLRTYMLTRVLLVIPMVLILLTVVFILMRVAPGDPVQAALGGRVPEEVLDERREAAGYNRPLIVQYWDYLSQVLTGDLGRTVSDNRPVTEVIINNGGATLALTVSAVLVALVIGLPLGILAGRYRDTWFDTGARLFGIVTYAAPVFFLGLLAQLTFGRWLGWLPTSDQASPIVTFEMQDHVRTHILIVDALLTGNSDYIWDVTKHLILPAFVLGLLLTGVVIRLVRVNMMQSLQGDYIEAARARGVKERSVVMRHAFRNALVPVITVMGLQVALLLGGAVLTEETFNWPGLGHQLIQYLNNRDYIAVQGIITVFALVVVFVSLLIDIFGAIIDPRVRY